ncbi:hypothetical protein BGZ79_000781 [Entomortierella chlamydospora]|nr:hypothetical protein BGZ79_000781 [Entomortierella chlamydospora]
MDQNNFWKLSSGRMVESVLFEESLKGRANFKVRSYTIDFDCPLTKALFTKDEWTEMKRFDDFKLPLLPASTSQYINLTWKALKDGQHVASVPVPIEDRFSCDQVLKSLLSWTHLYTAKPSPFGNSKLSETYWSRQGWPIVKELFSDIDGITMVDGEKHGLESTKRNGKNRRLDIEGSSPRKPGGKKLDLVARDTTNNRDWFIVESMKDWDETSTKFLHETSITLFKQLHLIASHRIQEARSSSFKNNARCVAETIEQYSQASLDDEVDGEDESWIYDDNHRPVEDVTLGSSPLGPDADFYTTESSPLGADDPEVEAMWSDSAFEL